MGGYVENNDLVCFGMSEHEFAEHNKEWSPQAERDLAIVATWCKRRSCEDIVRPVYRSDNSAEETAANRAYIRCGLAWAALRELPIKSFYVRAGVMYFAAAYWLTLGLGPSVLGFKLMSVYNTEKNTKMMLNYPDLFWWCTTSVCPQMPPVPDVSTQWKTRQRQAYHPYHNQVYRYRFRKPRFVQWDGSMNQPVMPFLHDRGTGVMNGTFRINANVPDAVSK